MPNAPAATLLPKLVAATPSALMALAFLWVWINPYAFGPQSVRDLLLVLAVEWLLVLSTLALIWLQPAADGPPRALHRLLVAHVLSQLIALLVVAWLLQAPWVLIALLLMAERQYRAWRTAPGSDARQRHAIEAGVAFGLFLVAVFVALMLPLPQLGLPDSLWIEIERLGLGLHVDEVQPALALGLLYFAGSAVWRWQAEWWMQEVPAEQAESDPS